MSHGFLLILFILFSMVGWTQPAPPTEEQMNAAEQYSIQKGGQTFLVIYKGNIIRQTYSNGGSADRLQLLASGTKGFTGMIGAIAAYDGIINLDNPVAEVLTEWANDVQKSKITYRHLLTMSSGLEELKDQSAWTDFLNARVLYTAGSTFIYGPDPNIFGLALQRKLGAEKVEDYMNRRLFQPLGIRVEWRGRFADGNPQLSGGAYVRANEWYKFGEFVRLMMTDSWNGPLILSKPFLQQVITSSQTYPAYGFYWWLKEPVPASIGQRVDEINNNQYTTQIKPILTENLIPDDFVMCRGAYGQCLYVIPSRELVVVRNAPSTARELYQDDELLALLLSQTTDIPQFQTINKSVKIYPNPATSLLYIQSDLNQLFYSIYTTDGAKIINERLSNGIININHLVPGNYLIRISDMSGRMIATKNWIKK